MISISEVDKHNGITFAAIEAYSAAEFANKLNEFVGKFTVKSVQTFVSAAVSGGLLHTAHIWHYGQRKATS